MAKRAIAATRRAITLPKAVSAFKMQLSNRIDEGISQNLWNPDTEDTVLSVKPGSVRQWINPNIPIIPEEINELAKRLYPTAGAGTRRSSLTKDKMNRLMDYWRQAHAALASPDFAASRPSVLAEGQRVEEMSPEELEAAIEKELGRSRKPKLSDVEAEQTRMFGDEDHFTKVSPRVTAIAKKLKPIPEQGPGPHFALSTNSKITQMKPSQLDETGNDMGRINGLLPLIKDALADLEAEIGPGSNASPGLVRDVNRYRDAINSPEGTVQWAVVWGLGVRLQNASIAAERDVEDRMAPALEDETKGALDALLDFHGPLIMATSQGRELQEQADKNRMTRADQHKLRNHAVALSQALGADDNLVEKDTADIADIATDVIGQGSHPERGTTFGATTIRSIVIVLLSGAIAASPHELIQAYPSVGVAASMAAWEVAKKTAAFTSAVKTLGLDIDRLAEWMVEVKDTQLPRFMPFRRFVLTNDVHLRGIAQSSSSLRWLNGYIDLIQAIEKAARDRDIEWKP